MTKATDRQRARALLGKRVLFAHRPAGVPPARVVACDSDGLVELEGWSGLFAASCFVVAEEPPEPEDHDALR